MLAKEEDFRGTGRFSVRRRLGAGAYGVVYEAFDRERAQTVALKTLRKGTADALYRLKREFRALADISHANLATLHEMLADGDHWFMTMELVVGESFLQYTRADPPPRPEEPLDPTMSEASLEADVASRAGSAATAVPFDEPRLRESLRQSVVGVLALHAAGKLHRDIKPSNVLITKAGRVVMLDFGLVAELDTLPEDHSLSLVGTPTYMAPELGSRASVSEASDWYSLGVMLYEALTGRPPFVGTFPEMMWAKNRGDPPRPRTLVRPIPEDLDVLCMDLLSREPGARPSGGEILRRLGGEAAVPSTADVSVASLRQGPFVGRRAHLAVLTEAFEASRAGQTATVYVHGTSGIGKSALVRRFLTDARSENTVVLTGRCYERESTPYKAMDSVIDSLSQYLKRLPAAEAEALLPADILALTRVFPVLRRVEAIASTRRKVVEVADSLELRRRAFTALRELLVRLALRRDVVLFIDDLQWGDADSAALLEELMRPPDSPALLLIGAYRSEDAGTSPLLLKLLAREEGPTTRRVAVQELAPEEARELAVALLESRPSALSAQADAIARESAGNPFFIDELIRFGRLGAETTLDALVRARVLQLPESARLLLEVVAVAGQPLDAEIAATAAEIGDEDAALAILRAGRLVRVRAVGGRREIEPYHDRIRETVAAHVEPATLRDLHRRLARTLEVTGAEPEQLVRHFQEAGEPDRAARYASAAADRAAEALAFDRAAKLYRLALELEARGDAERRRDLGVRLGNALANAGRGAEAAKAYLSAAEGAPPARAVELEGRAAGHLLQAGHVAEALPIFEHVTGRLGLTLVQSTAKSWSLYLLQRAAIRIRGLRFRERDASQIPPEQLIRLDSFWLLASGMVLINTIRARELNNRHMLAALRVGEPFHAAIALATELGVAGTVGWRLRRRIEKVRILVLALAERLGDPRAIGMAHAYAAAGDLLLGRFRAATEHGRTAERVYRERCTGVAWEMDFAHAMLLRALAYLGELREISIRIPALIREARERDDLVAAVTLQIRHAYLPLLAADRPDEARDLLRRMSAPRPGERYGNKEYWALITSGEIFLFEGASAEAFALVAESWPQFRRSGFVRFQFYRLEVLHLRARSALQLALHHGTDARRRRSLLGTAARDARRMTRERTPWARALALLLEAGIASAVSPGESPRLLDSAERAFSSLDMALYAAAAKRRRGQLLGGDEGAALVAEADAWMAAQDIRNPARMADMLAPGRWS